MMKMLLCCVLLLAVSGVANATGLELPIEGATAVWVQPIGSDAGSMGASLSLTLPPRVVGDFISELVKAEVVIRSVADQVRVDPGLSISLTTDVGVPVKVGLLAMPLTEYKVGWFIGVEVFGSEF